MEKTSQDSTSSSRKFLPGMFLGHALSAEGFCKGDILFAVIEELENVGRVRNPCSKAQMPEK